MFDYTRTMFKPGDFKGLMDRDLKTIPVYAIYATDKKITKHVTQRDVIQIARRVVGDTVWQNLLKLKSPVVIEIAAEIFEDHLYTPDIYNTKDLQLNLLINVVKDLATDEEVHRAKHYSLADEIVRKLGLADALRGEVHAGLTTCLHQPWLAIHRKAS